MPVRHPKTPPLRQRTLHRESGQAAVLLLLILGAFLLASVGFAVDLSNMWFHRQAAQTAADSACVAGAMDMLYLQRGTLLASPGFTVGAAGDCSSAAIAALCQYAGFNGYTANTSGSGWGSTTPSGAIAVSWSFPTSVSGVTPAPGIAYPFLNVVVREKPSTWFMGMMGIQSMSLGASCTCGLPPGTSPAPLLVLHPTLASALTISGGAHIVVRGGQPTSIQVNSSANGSPSSNASSNAIYCSGGSGYAIDASAAGPGGNGGNVALVGGPTTNQFCGASYMMNNTTHSQWKSPVAAAADPYASVPNPTFPIGWVPEATTPVATVLQGYIVPFDLLFGFIYGTWVGSGTDGCPNTAPQQHWLAYSLLYPYNSGNIYGNCLEFTPGYYPNGINTTSLAGYANDVVIFMPGIYYMNGPLVVGSATTVRNAWSGTQPSAQGVMFYFLNGGPTFAGGSGTPSSVINAVPSYYMNCSGTTTPSGMPASLTGNVLLAQCSTSGTYVGSPNTDTYSTTGSRGLLFFSDHANTYSNTLLGAGATLNFGGALYFHNSSYTDLVQLSGAGSSTNYAVGSIIVDQLTLNGSGTISMNLSGAVSTGLPQVSIFQ
jgi:hypothetical protein